MSGRLHHPEPLPELADAPRAAWHSGWWAGIAVGTVSGMGIAVLLGIAR